MQKRLAQIVEEENAWEFGLKEDISYSSLLAASTDPRPTNSVQAVILLTESITGKSLSWTLISVRG